MVGSVNTNINAMAAVQSLMEIGNQMTSTQNAIQSGLKVASASDNPAVFTIAQGLRANVDALSAVSDSLSTGLATVQAQIQGATSISNALNTLLQTVTQAQSDTGAALTAANTTITNALSNIDAYANASTINNVNLLSSAGSLNVLSAVDGSDTTVTTTTASTAAGLGLTGLAVSAGGTELTSLGANATAGDTVTYNKDSNSNTIVFEFDDGSQALTTTPTAGTTTAGVVSNSVTVVGVNIGATDAESTGNLLAAMQEHGVAATEDSSGNITVTGGLDTGNLAVSGSGTLFNATTAVGGGTAAIDAVNAAIVTIGKTLSALGAASVQLNGLSDFTSQLQDSVSTGLGAIVDANLSEESAKLSSLQTKQSLAIQSLSLANQGPSALLQLFR